MKNVTKSTQFVHWDDKFCFWNIYIANEDMYSALSNINVLYIH